MQSVDACLPGVASATRATFYVKKPTTLTVLYSLLFYSVYMCCSLPPPLFFIPVDLTLTLLAFPVKDNPHFPLSHFY